MHGMLESLCFLDEIPKIFLFPFTECEIDSIAWSDDSFFLAIGER